MPDSYVLYKTSIYLTKKLSSPPGCFYIPQNCDNRVLIYICRGLMSHS